MTTRKSNPNLLLQHIGTAAPEGLYGLADSLRKLMTTMSRIDRPSDELERARAEIEIIRERLESVACKGDKPKLGPADGRNPERHRPYYAGNLETWHYNPINPPTEVEIIEGRVRGQVQFDLPWEGPPGCVHGGVVAMFFDQLLGHANTVHGVGAMTAHLEVDYRRPTPLFTKLSFEAAVESVEGRKCTTRGTLRAGDEVCAEASGLFIVMDFSTLHLP